MEDRALVCGEVGGLAQCSLFAVFDGHGGQHAADFCVDRMAQSVAQDRDFPHNPARALVSAFLRVDDEFVTAARSARPAVDDGTTAVVALVVGQTLYVANAGDSRAILVQRGGRVEPLSADHKPNRPDETLRIKAAGGSIYFNGVWRVSGVLAVSRAIGDRLLKPYVTARPEVRTWSLTQDDATLILATDGVWDVLSNRNVADIALTPGGTQRVAERIVSEALASGSADNVTALVVDLSSSRFAAGASLAQPPLQAAEHESPSSAIPTFEALQQSGSPQPQQTSLQMQSFEQPLSSPPEQQPPQQVQSLLGASDTDSAPTPGNFSSSSGWSRAPLSSSGDPDALGGDCGSAAEPNPPSPAQSSSPTAAGAASVPQQLFPQILGAASSLDGVLHLEINRLVGVRGIVGRPSTKSE